MDKVIKYVNENYTLEIGLQEISSKFFFLLIICQHNSK